MEDKKYHKMVGERIRLARLRKFGARSKSALGAAAGVTDVTIAKVEAGEVSCSLETMRKIAGALEIPFHVLTAEADGGTDAVNTDA